MDENDRYADLLPAHVIEDPTQVHQLEDKSLPVTPLLIQEWLVVAAIHGTGSLLLGPHTSGAQALVPPSVLTRAPIDSDERQYSDDGWRIAIWGFVQGDIARVDAHRPLSLVEISMLQALDFVCEHAPDQEAWILDEIELRARCLATLVRYADTDGDTLAVMQDELDELMLDCTSRLGARWVSQRLSRL